MPSSMLRPLLAGGMFALSVVACGGVARAQVIEGTATYKERMALPAGSIFEATLEDVSRSDAPALLIGTSRNTAPGNPPIAFAIAYDPARIAAKNRYVVRARILLGDRLLFTSDTATPVITYGSPTRVSLMLRRVASAPSTPEGMPLEETYWKAVELAGTPVPSQDASREAHLVFEPGGRVSGSDGCNRVSGSYQVNGEGVTFGRMAGTQMACISSAGIEGAFREALKNAARWRIAGNRLELLAASGSPVAVFEGRAPGPVAADLPGTAWQLVRFQGGDEKVLTPDDRSKYTIAFGRDGQLSARFDCNRGRGAWESPGPNQLQFGSMVFTRAQCPTGSLHDQMVRQWGYIRSYVIKDGHLFLSLMADGGIYEFEPIASSSPPAARP